MKRLQVLVGLSFANISYLAFGMVSVSIFSFALFRSK